MNFGEPVGGASVSGEVHPVLGHEPSSDGGGTSAGGNWSVGGSSKLVVPGVGSPTSCTGNVSGIRIGSSGSKYISPPDADAPRLCLGARSAVWTEGGGGGGGGAGSGGGEYMRPAGVGWYVTFLTTGLLGRGFLKCTV